MVDKSLGTNLHLWLFSHVPNEQPGANSSTYFQPLPPPPPLYNVGHVHTLEIQHCMGGKGGKQRILKRKTVLF